MTHILIVEDEPKLARLLQDYCQQAGYQTDVLLRGDEVLPWLAQHTTDAMVLDVMLPGEDGISVCRKVRSQSVLPILLATAKVDEIDRLLGLELGADDYICKPYSPREVIARIKAVLRRSQGMMHSPQHDQLQLDATRLLLRRQQQVLELTAVEFQLFKKLYEAPGQIFSRQQLMSDMYDDHRIVSDRTVDSHIKKIRKKLTDVFGAHDYIQSVYGAGYRYQPEMDDDY